MSLSLDDKLLGEKVHNYCSSSSEDEGDNDSADNGSICSDKEEDIPDVQAKPTYNPAFQSTCSTTVSRTGPKGVLSDYHKYREMASLLKAEKERAKIRYAKLHALMANSYVSFPSLVYCHIFGQADDLALEEHPFEQEKDPFVLQLSRDANDQFIQAYQKKRMEEMKSALEASHQFGKMHDLNVDNFVESIDNAGKLVSVIVHIYESVSVNRLVFNFLLLFQNNRECRLVDDCLKSLCEEYTNVKFCRIRASDARMSHRFSRAGVPAILVYKNGDLVGSFLRITSELGNDFCAGDLENYLIEHGLLPDKSLSHLLNLDRSTIR